MLAVLSRRLVTVMCSQKHCVGSAVKALGDSDVFITILCVGSAVKAFGDSDVLLLITILCVGSAVKALGDSDSGDDSASAWVKKNRKLQKEKELADKRVGFFLLFILLPVVFGCSFVRACVFK